MMSLPILSSRFFKKHRPDGGFFSKWAAFYTWNEHTLPIYEWEGVLFVGCSRPPAETPEMGDQKVVFVLCEPGILQELWWDFQALQKAGKLHSAPAPEARIPGFTGILTPPEVKDLPHLPEAPMASEDETKSDEYQPEPTMIFQGTPPSLNSQLPTENDNSKESVNDFSNIPNLDLSSAIPTLPETAAEPEPVFATDFSNLAVDDDEPIENLDEPLKTAIFNPNDLAAAAPESPAKSDQPTLDLSQDLALESEPVAAKKAPQEDVPEGFSLDLSANKASSPQSSSDTLELLDTEESESENADTESESESDGALELLDLSGGGGPVNLTALAPALTPVKLEALAPTEQLAASDSDSSRSVTLDLEEEEKTQATQTMTTAKEEEPLEVAPSAEVAKKSAAMDLTSKEEKRAVPVRSEVISGSEITRWSHQVLTGTPAGKMDPWLLKLFQEMHGKFKKSMVLLKKGDFAKPWKWDPNFKQDPSTRAEISLVQPSPFRIVARTKKPYHGYVVSNEINQRFFAEWNEAQIPEHLTIAPILVDDHVIGVLLAIGDKSSDSKEALNLAENVANHIAKQVKAQPDSVRAA